MKQVFRRGLNAAQLDRRVFTEIRTDPAGPADGAMMVAVVAAVVFLAGWLRWDGLSLENLVRGLLDNVVGWVAAWLLLAVFTWVGASKVFRGHGEMRDLIAVQGIGFLPNALALTAAVTEGPSILRYGGLVGYFWYLVVAAIATEVIMRLPRREAALSVLIGLAGVLVLDLLLGRSLQVVHMLASIA